MTMAKRALLYALAMLGMAPLSAQEKLNADTADELTAVLNGAKDKVKAQIVLVGKSVAVPVNLNPSRPRSISS